MAPLRALKTDEEAASIPLDQPILVELPGGVIDEPKETAKTELADPDAKRLQEQLEASQAAQRAADARAEKAERDAADARRIAAEVQTRNHSLEGDVITGGLAAAQAELTAAEQELERAGEAGDFKAMAKAQSRIGRASAQVVNLESGAAEIAERKPAKVETAPEPRQQPTDINVAIDNAQHLLPAEKTWLKSHPDAFMPGPRNNELSVGYERALKQGLVRGTQQYFDYLEDFMGYAKPSTNEGNRDVQAPPSRNERGGDGRPSGNRITLSPEQREFAKSIGVSEIEYARQVQQFETARKNDPEKYNSRG